MQSFCAQGTLSQKAYEKGIVVALPANNGRLWYRPAEIEVCFRKHGFVRIDIDILYTCAVFLYNETFIELSAGPQRDPLHYGFSFRYFILSRLKLLQIYHAPPAFGIIFVWFMVKVLPDLQYRL